MTAQCASSIFQVDLRQPIKLEEVGPCKRARRLQGFALAGLFLFGIAACVLFLPHIAQPADHIAMLAINPGLDAVRTGYRCAARRLTVFGRTGAAASGFPVSIAQGPLLARRPSPRVHSVVRMAAPQYTSQAALVSASRPVSPNGRSWLLQLSGQESPTAYEPGHVLAIEVDHEGTTLKGPYTVTRSDATSRTIDCIYRVIEGLRESSNGDHVASGVRKTHVFKSLETGAPAAFGGSFHVPILRGIAPTACHAFLLSTGTGVGPMIGFIEQCIAMWQGTPVADAPEHSQLERVTLFAGYRELGDVICAEELQALVAASKGRFEWHACISGADELSDSEAAFSTLEGRITNAAPPRIASALEEGFKGSHFHMIGNGAMVKEWKLALGEAGVPEEQVTLEMYFGHKAEPDQKASERIKQGLLRQVGKAAVA